MHVLVTAVPVVVLLLPRQLVLMDGGLHLASATAVRGVLTGRWPDLVEWRPVLAPNLVVEAVIAVLSGVLDADTTIRILAVAVVVGASAAALALARAAGAPVWAATLMLPFAANVALMAGLLGFAAATVLATVTAAAVLRARRRRAAVLVGLLALTWFTHLLPALAGAVVVAAVLLVEGGPRRVVRVGGPALAVVAALTLGFALTGGSDGGASSTWFGGGARAADLTKAVATWSPWEYQLVRPLTVLLVAATVAALVLRRRGPTPRSRPVDGLLLAAVVLGAVAVVVPESIGSVSLTATRLAVLPPVLLAAWVGAQAGAWEGRRPPRPVVALVSVAAVAAALVTVGVSVVRAGPLVDEGARLDGIRSLAVCAPPGGTIVQFNLDDGRDRAVTLRPAASFAGYLAADADLLDVGNVSGTASYYVWGFTPRARPVPLLAPSQAALEDVPPDVDLGAALRAGRAPAAVLVVGQDVAGEPGWTSVAATLRGSYRQEATTGAGSLWVRRDVVAPCG